MRFSKKQNNCIHEFILKVFWKTGLYGKAFYESDV